MNYDIETINYRISRKYNSYLEKKLSNNNLMSQFLERTSVKKNIYI